MDVLVIGGNRFVGWLLGFRLLAAGHQVTLLNRGRLADPFGGRVDRIVADRTSRDLGRLLQGRRFDAVVDLAAFTGEDGRRATELLRDCGHYVMVSTGQVYLVREGAPAPAREEDYDGPVMARPADPADLADWDYGLGKRACEDALVAASGFPATRVRIPMVNGERDYHRRMESYLWRLVDGGPVILPDGGEHRVRHVYGGEVARFLVELLGRKETFGKAYNVAQQETPTLAELMALLRHHLGSAADVVAIPSERIRAAGLDPLRVSPFSGRWMSFVDPSRAWNELGFRHEPLEIYLGKIVASFLSHPPSDRPEGYSRRDVERALAAPGVGPTA
ncbi:NAD-dependent epimerase/dehydratase family protein [Anaeromyxobacter sp. SG64]|uniref:NAD-dependent epimerase/dehydratase family protein n=1 Tax=Anaeromyxobacter sp. SG64 TaxID=2925409 RepID=UPI001F58AFCA|nr:NAD-dependent epimerase/dehydratase family protein [Anaeromyxobacter sp. SG64]